MSETVTLMHFTKSKSYPYSATKLLEEYINQKEHNQIHYFTCENLNICLYSKHLVTRDSFWGKKVLNPMQKLNYKKNSIGQRKTYYCEANST